MNEKVIGKGWGFPVGIDKNGKFRTSTGKKAVEESIAIILNTAKGERINLPDFGCDINTLVFSPNTPETHNMISSYIMEAVSRWEPRVTLENVTVLADPYNPTQVNISISCTLIEENSELNMVYPFYLERG